MFLGSSSNGVIWPELLPEEAIEVFLVRKKISETEAVTGKSSTSASVELLTAVDGVTGPE